MNDLSTALFAITFALPEIFTAEGCHAQSGDARSREGFALPR